MELSAFRQTTLEGAWKRIRSLPYSFRSRLNPTKINKIEKKKTVIADLALLTLLLRQSIQHHPTLPYRNQ